MAQQRLRHIMLDSGYCKSSRNLNRIRIKIINSPAMKFQSLMMLMLASAVSPAIAETSTQNSFCKYFRHFEHPVASVQAPCFVKRYAKRNNPSKVDIYVQLIDGTSLFYDGDEKNESFAMESKNNSIYLKREGKSSLQIYQL